MASMTPVLPDRSDRVLFGGIDTHLDIHVAAVVDGLGGVVGTAGFSTTRAGYRQLTGWLQAAGTMIRVGVEGTGSYGAGITRHLAEVGLTVVEVNRPDRADRRRRGKSDTFDAIAAARAALAGEQTATPKSGDPRLESLRILRLTRASAVKARTKTVQLIRQLLITAPAELRDQVRPLKTMPLIRTCASWRPTRSNYPDPAVAARIALSTLARRYLQLSHEIDDLDLMLDALVADLAPQLLARVGVGTETAGQLLLTCGGNPDRIRTEAAFAMLCGVAPLPASSGQHQRHRLNRGGDRQANRALHVIATTRKRCDPRTQAYLAVKTQTHSRREATRCLKRLIAREMYYLINPHRQPTSHPAGSSIQANPAGAQERSRWSTPRAERP